MEQVYSKLKSRKFWITLAAILASIGTSVSGFVVGKYDLTIVGTICTFASGAIYSAINTYQKIALYELDGTNTPIIVQREDSVG